MTRFALLLLVLLSGSAPALAAGSADLAPAERQAMSDTLQHALENNPSDQAADWINPDSGRAGAVVPTRTFTGAAGQPCREFVTTITIAGEEQQGYGTACRQPDGSWQVVDDRPPGSAPPPAALSTPPERYYAYPETLYAPYTIYFSFGTLYRHGHFYRGRTYLDGPLVWTRYPLLFGHRHSPRPWYDDRYHRSIHRDRDHDRDRSRERDWDRDRNRDRNRDWDRDWERDRSRERERYDEDREDRRDRDR